MDIEKTSMYFYIYGQHKSGKTLTANMILDSKHFTTFHHRDSNECQKVQASEIFDNRKITVIDALKGKYSKKKLEKVLTANLDTAVDENNIGFHTFLYVIKYGSSFDADVEELEVMKKALGEKCVKEHMILVLTNGDTFQRESEENGFTFEQWCERQEGAFQTLMKACGNRIVLFDNMTYDDNKKKTQRDNLFAHVIELALERNLPKQSAHSALRQIVERAFLVFGPVSVIIIYLYVSSKKKS